MSDIGRNAPCPCGSGQKYKKCCLEKEQTFKIMERQKDSEVKCNICGKEFNKQSLNAFQSREQEGKRIYFCPDCNINLSCESCKEKLGNKGFDLYSCNECGGIYVICIDCSNKSNKFISHIEKHQK